MDYGVWVDPAFDRPDLVTALAEGYPEHALSTLTSPALTGDLVRGVLPHVRWSSAAVQHIGPAAIMRHRDADTQIDIVKAAARKSAAAANRLIPHLRIGALLQLWRETNTVRFSGSTRVREAIVSHVSRRDWATQSTDPGYLEFWEELWTSVPDGHDWRSTGVIAVRYAMGAVTDEHHARLVEMLNHWLNPFGNDGPYWNQDPASLLASTYQHPERVLQWAEHSDVGAVLAAADPRIPADVKAELRTPTDHGMVDAFERFRAETVGQADADRTVQRARLVEAVSDILTEETGPLTEDALRRWFEQARTFVRAGDGMSSEPTHVDLAHLVGQRHPAAGVLILDALHSPISTREMDDFLTRVYWLIINQPCAEAIAQSRPTYFAPMQWPATAVRLYRHPAAPRPHVHTGADAEAIACWTAVMQADIDECGMRAHLQGAPYLAAKLQTAQQLDAVYRSRLTGDPPPSLYAVVKEILDQNPAPDPVREAERFTEVFGDPLGAL